MSLGATFCQWEMRVDGLVAALHPQVGSCSPSITHARGNNLLIHILCAGFCLLLISPTPTSASRDHLPKTTCTQILDSWSASGQRTVKEPVTPMHICVAQALILGVFLSFSLPSSGTGLTLSQRQKVQAKREFTCAYI